MFNYKVFVAELIGTFALVFVGAAVACTTTDADHRSAHGDAGGIVYGLGIFQVSHITRP